MAEAESVVARKATLLNPTEDDETIHVLRRRLFSPRLDERRCVPGDRCYRARWAANQEALDPDANRWKP